MYFYLKITKYIRDGKIATTLKRIVLYSNNILFSCAVCCKRKHIIGAFHTFVLTEICLYLDVNFVHLYGEM